MERETERDGGVSGDGVWVCGGGVGGLWVMAAGAVCRIGAEINNSNQKLLASGSTGAMAASLPSPLLRW